MGPCYNYLNSKAYNISGYMFLQRALHTYITNFRAALAFLLLLVFIFPISEFFSSFVSSGTLFLDYNFLKSDIMILGSLLVVAVVFLFFYSLLQTLLIFAVRRDLSAVKVDYYLREQMQKFTGKIMVFNVLYAVIASWIAGLLILFGVLPVLVAFLLLLASLPFLFLPQAIVIDEHKLTASLRSSIGFMQENPKYVIAVIGIGFLLVFLVSLIEFAIDSVVLLGNYVTLILTLIFVIPFLEVLKTNLYMSKFGLITASTHLPIKKA